MKEAIKSIASSAIAGLLLTMAPLNTFADTSL
jgi:hypothetical protein